MSSTNVNDLFGNALDVGDLSPGAMQLVTVPDVGNQIQAGLGISVDDVSATDGVTLVGTLIQVRFALPAIRRLCVMDTT